MFTMPSAARFVERSRRGMQRGVAALALAAGALAAPPFAAAQHQYPSKVDIAFNRFYDYQQTTDLLHQLVAAYPELLSIQSLGKSIGGRDIWCVTLNNPKTGEELTKAAMFIDGNIHGNEIQASETVVYSIWYLTKSYGNVEALTKLVDERVFYFVPMENPDGRDVWFHQAATPHYLRGGILPTDNDSDGLYDEDDYDDLDGDGHITQMYRRDPLGRFKPDPKDPRFMIRVAEDEEPGGWNRAGSEGIDNDGDGDINEDGIGGYDPNRNWPSDWQPNHIQGGSGEYPFSLPETRAIRDFLLKKPNIAAFQSYHNSGGMILRGPGADYVNYPAQDIRVYDQLQDTGVFMLPGYRKMVIWSDLYVVHGGEVNWAYEGLGITSFTNELWSDWKAYQTDNPGPDADKRFTELLQFDEPLVPYKPFNHPTLGEVLIGGSKKWSSRVPPPWMSEEDCHRNFAFTMFHAREMPKVEWGLTQVRSMGGDVWELTIEVKNDKIIPTITAMARQKGIGRRDRLTCSGASAKVAAAGSVSSFLSDARWSPVEHEPHRLWVDGGIGGKSSSLFRFIVEGTGEVQLVYESEKGGTISQMLPLAEQIPPPAELPKEMTGKK